MGIHTDKLPRACSGVFLLSHVSTFFVLHQPVIRRLSGGRVRRPRHHQTAERRRCAGPLQCDVIDDTIKLLNELFVCIIVALVAVVSCGRKTHIGCILVFFDTLHEYEAITTLSPIPGSAAPRSSSPSTTPSGCWTTTQRGYHCCRCGMSGHAHAGFLSLCFYSCGWQDT